MRSYNEYCALARALDVVGQRWSLLIVRELLIRGACRYVDLLAGLPGIATNLLAERLRELEEADIVWREEAPAPVAATLFRLTGRGEALRTVIASLVDWGAPLVARPIGEEHFRTHWLILPLQLYLRDNAPEEPPVTMEIIAAEESIVAEAVQGQVKISLAKATNPDATVSASPPLILGLLTGRLELAATRKRGLRYEGSPRVLERFRPAPPATDA